MESKLKDTRIRKWEESDSHDQWQGTGLYSFSECKHELELGMVESSDTLKVMTMRLNSVWRQLSACISTFVIINASAKELLE